MLTGKLLKKNLAIEKSDDLMHGAKAGEINTRKEKRRKT